MTWSVERAERALLERELFGMRFGLERMQRLLIALGSPQSRLPRTIHMVGTNGKSSSTRFAAAILEAHGLSAGAYLSPHLLRFAERVRVGDRDIDGGSFAAALERAVRAAEKVDRTSGDDDRVTQFELLTAAALDELARREVDVAVIEAGLGGRYDATNVIHAPVVALTNVGLEHTRWLGPTVVDIAREKLAVLRPGATLVVGAGVDGDALREAEAAATERGATLVRAGAALDGVELAARGGYQRANFALAHAAAGALLGRDLDAGAVASAAAHVQVPGRCEIVDQHPLTILDGAHNPAGMAALAASLPELSGGRPVVAVVSILDDKDAAGMLRALMEECSSVVFTSNSNPRALPPATLQSLAGQLAPAAPRGEIEPDPRTALRRARDLAGRDGVVVATGSIYLVADLGSAPGERAASTL
jgi:dihydrofolate synthase/folylpolyglutamate synthase